MLFAFQSFILASFLTITANYYRVQDRCDFFLFHFKGIKLEYCNKESKQHQHEPTKWSEFRSFWFNDPPIVRFLKVLLAKLLKTIKMQIKIFLTLFNSLNLGCGRM